jgi:hypothetical protein
MDRGITTAVSLGDAVFRLEFDVQLLAGNGDNGR